MSKYFERDIETLEQERLAMSSQVEEMMPPGRTSLRSRHDPAADEVIDADKLVNLQEVRTKEECLKILALHPLSVIGLRRTATILKVNNDPKRFANLATNIAEGVVYRVHGELTRHRHTPDTSAAT